MKTKASILIIDDDVDILLSAKMLLKSSYERVSTLSDPKDINTFLSKEYPDLVLLDMNYRVGFNDGKEGMYWLEHIKSIDESIVVILMTAYGEVELAVNAIKKGAFDFILKPWTNEKFLASIHAGLALRKSQSKVKDLDKQNKALQKDILFNQEVMKLPSSSMSRLYSMIDKVASTDANVLILGENGTGKLEVAKYVHNASGLQGPFIHLDLGSLNENLFESELFGHVKGAFTDAKEDKAGRFEVAENGSLFLDEIANLPLHLQSKLLSVIQEKEYSPLGSSKKFKFNARLIFATNAPIQEWVEQGKFRQDLLYRINTVELTVDPLRERREDIEVLSEHFVKQFARKYGKPELSIESGTKDQLLSHNWPGNIRELRHSIERSVILSEGAFIELDSLSHGQPLHGSASTANIDSGLTLEEMEVQLIQKALDKHKQNISKTAKELGLTRAALYRRMEKYGI